MIIHHTFQTLPKKRLLKNRVRRIFPQKSAAEMLLDGLQKALRRGIQEQNVMIVRELLKEYEGEGILI